ncbi:OFA family MFS transporter [Photobacterium phosphoreum]|uniref:L-lactate MFS transporter n=1 Tax=Photobacterium phosphoreum TaxID=659 RepID=UPI000D1711CA|nr:OFA family MFS transporter [Photobacterium phosphoreum]MCD9462822.1 oxalate:formate antiporter [Photobacterium phosphoreum]MCD9470225.1 oxalate:formate antiporter [Photobacterium phosphoreum]MCD9504255.1 MFS transporter [Photobacterium phosphoreum]PSU40391.1 oxalate:formate antiporter [Photobacterium phosphoreum]PSW28215.1 oxalate:formate antiporter [Photobacterium phosphoreum]
MKKFDRAIQILVAGFCINLCMGILYAWSVFKKALVVDLGWSNADASLPYTVAIITFALSLLVAGILQDRMGPRRVLILGTVMVGLGMIVSSFATTPMMLVLTFGVMTGSGIGFGYACLSPSAMKWFHPSKKGLVNGLIAAGFGLAAVYLAPLTSTLIAEYGINTSFLVLGIAVLVIAVPLAFTINNPPAGYVPEAPAGYKSTSTKPADINWRGMLKTPQFYSLWVMFAFASAAGLMIIGNITSIAATQADITDAAYLVVILAIFNSGGRVAAGILSDKIGGVKTLMIAFVMQGINMVMFATFDSEFTLIIGAAVAGVGYGTLLAVFPSIIADFYGLKNYGANYGVLYTAWGVSGFIGPVVAAFAVDTTGTYTLAYTVCSVMIAVAVVLSVITKKVDPEALEKKLATA